MRELLQRRPIRPAPGYRDPGAGSTFCSGRDLGDARADAPLEEILAYDEDWTDIFHLLSGSAKPSVAIVEGHAVAGGFTLAMGCDFVVAEAGRDLVRWKCAAAFRRPSTVRCCRVSQGPGKALEYLLSADTFEAEHLAAAGLINRLAEGRDALEAAARDMCERLAALDPTAVKLTKDAHRMASVMPISEALVMGRQLNALLMATGRITAARDKNKGAEELALPPIVGVVGGFI
ncbi:MAG: enoyl-CoA hydratase/isomerase family protein [Hyphomicrobiaceae bacterium]